MKTNLSVIIVHGTWTTSRKWRDEKSNFRRWLAEGLSRTYGSIEYQAIEWNAKNRWAAREKATSDLEQTLVAAANGNVPDTEYLVVGHSHGGNIATEAVRQFLKTHPKFPLAGVVCLNTPFLKHELRASSAFLGVWLFVCILIGAALSFISSVAEPVGTAALELAAPLLPYRLRPSAITFVLFVFAGLLTAVTLLNRRLLRQRDKEEDIWGPRPPVLCLSCADDEAITLLGLGEGIANLPQLLFHPVAFAIALLVSSALLLLQPDVHLCALKPMCWAVGSLALGVGLVAWIATAIVGGLLGSLGITILFGLNRRMFLESLVSRVLVTYTPLKPADSSFRAIVDVKTKWSPAQLLHSRIYESKAAIDELCGWLKLRRASSASAIADAP